MASWAAVRGRAFEMAGRFVGGSSFLLLPVEDRLSPEETRLWLDSFWAWGEG
jgi:hypothetical protein